MVPIRLHMGFESEALDDRGLRGSVGSRGGGLGRGGWGNGGGNRLADARAGRRPGRRVYRAVPPRKRACSGGRVRGGGLVGRGGLAIDDVIGNPMVDHNGIVDCTCNQTYCATDADDVRNHAQHHDEFVRVTRNKGHVPYGYMRREQLKNEGRELLRNATSGDDVRVASDMIVRAHYDRSFQRSIENGYGDLHPTLPEYARIIAEDGPLDPRVNAVLQETYRGASRTEGTIKDTYWDPPARVRTWGTNGETN
jgi:hypothetical protein